MIFDSFKKIFFLLQYKNIKLVYQSDLMAIFDTFALILHDIFLFKFNVIL